MHFSYVLPILLCSIKHNSATTIRNKTENNEFARRWPNAVVPYILPTNAEIPWKSLFFRVIRDIHDGTCIRFRLHRDGDANWINVRNAGFPDERCDSSHLGMKGGEQDVYLDDPKCRDYGTFLRSFLAVLGMIPENNRNDRDQHIQVLWDNIKKEDQQYFYTVEQRYPDYEEETFGYPYDLLSGTRYDMNYLSGKYPSTLPFNYSISHPQKPAYDVLVEPVTKPSYYDIRNLLQMYLCPVDFECRPPM